MKQILLAMLFTPFIALATTWYVNGTTGSNSYSGTSSSRPKVTIQAAVDSAGAGDVVLVAAGTYNEKLEISRGITLKSSAGAKSTIVKGCKGYSVIRIQSGTTVTTIEGFTITGGTGDPQSSSYGHDYYGGGIRCLGNAVVKNCIVKGNGTGTPKVNSGTFGGGITSSAKEVLVENCLVCGNFAWASGGGVFVEGSGNVIKLVGCTVCGNDSTNFFGYQGGVGMANGGRVEIMNSLIWDNGGLEVDAYSWPYNSGTSVFIAGCCVQNDVVNTHIASVEKNGVQTANPRFVDEANGDYRLAANSPYIDAGNNSYVTTATDLAGNVRVAKGKVDLGCYEYGAASATCKITFNANGGDNVPAAISVGKGARITSLPSVSRVGYTFLGWYTSKNGGTQVEVGNTVSNSMTLYAHWEKAANEIVKDANFKAIDPFAFSATVYNGYLYREDGRALMGTLQVKAGKPKLNKKNGKLTSKLSIKIQMLNDRRKLSVKGVYDLNVANAQSFVVNGYGNLVLLLGSNGLRGAFGGYAIDGAPNIFVSKDVVSKSAASAAMKRYLGKMYGVVADEGYLTVKISAKGKSKVSGTMSSGKRVSAPAQLIVGCDGECIPVVVPKLDLALKVWMIGEGCVAEDLTGAVADKIGTLSSQSRFAVDSAGLLSSLGRGLLVEYLPVAVPVVQDGSKWVVDKGMKAGKVTLGNDGDIDKSKLGTNPSGLKLKYTPKNGAFKGSFKAYVRYGELLKAIKIKVVGVMVGNRAYGQATIKGVGGVSVMIK